MSRDSIYTSPGSRVLGHSLPARNKQAVEAAEAVPRRPPEV